MGSKIFAIGDIHGMFESLLNLLEKRILIRYNVKKLIFTGDYVDRGPDSKRVIDFLIELKKDYEVILLMGNHEDMMLDYYSKLGYVKYKPTYNYSWGIWDYNGGVSTRQSFGGDSFEKVQKYIDFLLNELKFFHIEKIRNKKYLFVHAGVNPFVPLKKQKPMDMLWIREEFLFHRKKYEDYTIIHGHTPTHYYLYSYDPDVKKIDSEIIRINIDTGCVYGGRLTALGIDLDTEELVFEQVECS